MSDSNIIDCAEHANKCFKRNLKRCYISHKNMLCYVFIHKNACTTLRNWFADVESLRDNIEETRKQLAYKLMSRFPEIPFEEAVKFCDISDFLAKVSPGVVTHTFEKAMTAFSSEKYFRFTVVRNPYTRIFSSWADKVLQGSYPKSRRLFGAADFYSRPVFTVKQCAENFEEFLSYIDKNREMLYQNTHWAPQFTLTRPDKVTYDCIAKLEDPAPLLEALRDRLGPDAPPPLRAKLNKTPLAYCREILTPGAQALILKLYAEDFKAFAYDAEPPATPAAVPQADMEAELYRIAERRLRRSQHEYCALKKRLRALRKDRLRAACYALSGKLERVLDPERDLLR